jgi:hypothetical protein
MKCRVELRSLRPDGRKMYGCSRRGCTNEIGPTPHDIDRVHPGMCSTWPEWHEWGEILSLVISVAGVTPNNWTWLQRKLGLIEPHEQCDCDRYREWLNTLGGRLCSSTGRVSKLLAWLLVRRV